MMNVLTDILCDTSSLLAPQSYKGDLSQNKLITPHNVPSEQGQLHLLDSVSHISHMERPLSSVNNSSPSGIDIFNTPSQIHIPSNMDSGFDDRSQVSVFSDQFPEIVPSWLTHDFMKVSDNLPSPDILSNVSDIYPSRENEHLEMLDLGFPPELTSQGVSNLNRPCIDDGQKLLAELPMQRFSNNDPLLISSFNHINTTHLHMSMSKNDLQYQKYKPNPHHVDASQSLMNSVMPCENELLHLPLPSSLAEQCLNSTSSPSMMPNSQSQSHPVDVVCDKLPQINLNHLDSLLGNDATLSEIHLLRHDFPNVRLHEENCNTQTNHSCLDNCNSNQILSCNTGHFLSSEIPSMPHKLDASVQVPENDSNVKFGSESLNCFSCSQVPLEMAFEQIQCYKCKFCEYISVHKCAVSNHVDVSHSNSINSSDESAQRSGEINSKHGGHSEAQFSVSEKLVHANVPVTINTSLSTGLGHTEREVVTNISNHFQCIKCNNLFSDITSYNSHLIAIHNVKPDHIHSNAPEKRTHFQSIPANGILINSDREGLVANELNSTHTNCNSTLLQNGWKKNLKEGSQKRRISPKKSEDSLKKNFSKKVNAASTNNSSEKPLSSHKKAWQKKMKRELGSYICEFKGCNVRFRALDNLEYHRKCHISGGNSFACPECGTSFENWGPVAGHLWRDHGNDMELHACDQCQFRTYSLSRLENIHKRTHKDEYLFLCDTCGKSFKTGKQLHNHRAIHSKNTKIKNLEEFKCGICTGIFASKRVLRMHEETVHNKMKPYICSYCDYTASKHSTLQLHMRVHTGEKPFKCDKCKYVTADHNSLRRHKMTHSGEKPYKCPYCPYSSIQANSYKDHLKKHPGQNDGLVFSCNICSFRTLKQDSFAVHMTEHESLNRPQNDIGINEINSTDDIFPLAEAMDISLSHGDRNLLSNFNNKNVQPFFNNLNINMVSVCPEGAN